METRTFIAKAEKEFAEAFGGTWRAEETTEVSTEGRSWQMYSDDTDFMYGTYINESEDGEVTYTPCFAEDGIALHQLSMREDWNTDEAWRAIEKIKEHASEA